MKPPEYYEGRPQTYLKHFFLEKYLERVAYNIFSFEDKFVYVDGFSGPWKSEDEAYEDTSFVIALNKLRDIRQGLREQGKDIRIRCLFIEKEPRRFEELQDAVRLVTDFEITPILGNFEDKISTITSFIHQDFSLVFIDPIGWKGFALQKIRPLLNLRGEVLINFMFDAMNRFLKHPNPENAATIDDLFGDPDWFSEFENLVAHGETREDAVLKLYRERFRQGGQFPHVTTTRIMKPLHERTYFHLVYGTRHWKGLLEFRGVEKKAVDVQERLRAGAKYKRKLERTGMADLFGPLGPEGGPRSFDDERTRQLEAAEYSLQRLLHDEVRVPYERILGSILERPLVWESDIKDWLVASKRSGKIEIEGLGPRERVPKAGHVIIYNDQG